MKLVLIAAFIAVSGAAKLDHTHQAPASAITAGGSSGFLQTPFFRSSSKGFGSLPTGGYTNNFQGVVVDAAATGSRASSAAEESGLGGPRASYGSADSKVGDAAFRGSVAGFRNSVIGFNVNQNNQGTERNEAANDRNSNTLAFAHNVGTNKYNYGFETDNGISVGENGVAAGGVQAQGGYSYKGDDGKEYKVTYTAGKDGYQPKGDHLPVPPPIPYEIVQSLSQNAQEEAAGLVHDGSYDAQKYNAGGDYAGDNSGSIKYNGVQSTQFGKRPESDVTTSDTFSHNSQTLGKPSALSGQFGFGFNSQQNSNGFTSSTGYEGQYNQIGTKFESSQSPQNDVDQIKPNTGSGSSSSLNVKPGSFGLGSSTFGIPTTGSFGLNGQTGGQASSLLGQTQNTFGTQSSQLGIKPFQQGIGSQDALSAISSSISGQSENDQFDTQEDEGHSTLSQTQQLSSFGSSITKPSLPNQNQIALGSAPFSLPQTPNRFGLGNGYLPPVNTAQASKPQGLFNQNTLSTGSSSIFSQQPVKTQFGTQAINPQASTSTLSENAHLSGNAQPSATFGSTVSKPSLPGQNQVLSAFGSAANDVKPQGFLSQNTLSSGSSSIFNQQPVKTQFGAQPFNNQGVQGLLSTSQNTFGSGNQNPTSFGSVTSTPTLAGQVLNKFGSVTVNTANQFPQTPNRFGAEYLPPVNSNEQGLKPQGPDALTAATASSQKGNEQRPENILPGNNQVQGETVGSTDSASASVGQLGSGIRPAQPLSYQIETSPQKPVSFQGPAQSGSLTAPAGLSITDVVKPSLTSTYTSNIQQATTVPLTELTTPLEPNEVSQALQGSQLSSQSNIATIGSQSSNKYPLNNQLGSSSNNAPVAPTFSTLSSSRPQGISSQQYGLPTQASAFPTQVTQEKEPVSQNFQSNDKNSQFGHTTFSQGQFGLSSSKPSVGQSQGNDYSYHYNQPSKPFTTPGAAFQGSKYPTSSSYQLNGVAAPSQSGSLNGFTKYPLLAPIAPTAATQKEAEKNQGSTFTSNYNGITQASISPFPSASPATSTQFNTPQTSQFGSLINGKNPDTSSDKSSLSTSTQQYQGTLYQYNKPAESLPASGNTDSSASQSVQGSSALKPQLILTQGSQVSTDAPQFGIQSTSNRFGENTESAQPNKPFGSATFTSGSSSFGSLTSQQSKPQFGIQTTNNQLNKPFGSSSFPSGSSFSGSQTAQETKPQFGTQSTFNKYSQNTQSAQPIKPFGSAPSTQVSNTFGSQNTQETKPQFGTQSPFIQFGQNTQLAQPNKYFASMPSTQVPSASGPQTTQGTEPQFSLTQGSQTSTITQQESKPQFGTQTIYNQSNKPFGSTSFTSGSSSFGSQITQESEPQFGSQTTTNQFGLNTQSIKPLENGVTSTQVSSTFGSQTAQETKPQFGLTQGSQVSTEVQKGSKPQFGIQSTNNRFGENTQSAQPIKPFGSTSFTSGPSSFGSQITQESKPQIGGQSASNQFGLNTQSIKPLENSVTSTQVSSTFGSQTVQETKPQFGTQSTYNQFGQNTQSVQSNKYSSAFGSQTSQETKPQFSLTQGSQTSTITQQESKPQFGIQSTNNRFGENTQSAQPIKPFGSTSFTSGSSSFGSQTSQQSKPQFGTQTTNNQSNKPFGSTSFTSGPSSFGSQITQESKPQIGGQSASNQFGLNTQSIKPQENSPTSSQVSSTFGSQTVQETKPQFGTQSTYNQFGQNTQSVQSNKYSSAFGSQTSQETKPQFSLTQGSQTSTITQQESKPQFGIQSTNNRFGENTQSAQPIKPFGSTSFTSGSSSFGSQTSQQSKPQFGTQTTNNQSNKPFGSTSFTSGSSSFGSQIKQESKPQFGSQTTTNQFGLNTQSIKPFENSVTSTQVSSTFGSQTAQETKPQFGTQSTYSQFGQNTQSAQPNKYFGSTPSTQVSSSFGSQATQETKPQFGLTQGSQVSTEGQKGSTPQFGIQLTNNRFGENTQSAQPTKPFGSTSFTSESSSFGSQTSQQSKPQFGTQTTYNQSNKPFGSTSFTSGSSSFGSQFTQESKPQFGAQSTYNQFSQNTQSAQPNKYFGSTPSGQVSSAFGSQTTQESKPQFGTQTTYNQQIKPFGSAPSTSSFNSFGYQTSQSSKPQFGTQLTYNKFSQNTQSNQAFKPFGSAQTVYQTGQSSQTQFGSQSQKPFGSAAPSSAVGQTTGSLNAGSGLGSTGSSFSTPSIGQSSEGIVQNQLTTQNSGLLGAQGSAQTSVGKGELFGGPRDPPKFDDKTGYHY